MSMAHWVRRRPRRHPPPWEPGWRDPRHPRPSPCARHRAHGWHPGVPPASGAQRRLLFATALLTLLTACAPSPDTTTTTPTTPTVQTVALWLFDEPAGLYPSHTLDDMSDNDMVLSLGLGAQVAPGHYGNALLLAPLAPPLDVPPAEEKPEHFGLARLPPPDGRTVEPLSWFTAHYAALMTSGENHLRKQVGHKNPTDQRPQPRRLRLDRRVLALPGRPVSADAPADGRRPTDEAVIFETRRRSPRRERHRDPTQLVRRPFPLRAQQPTRRRSRRDPHHRHRACHHDHRRPFPRLAPLRLHLRLHKPTSYATTSTAPSSPCRPQAALEALLPEGDEAYFTLASDGLFSPLPHRHARRGPRQPRPRLHRRLQPTPDLRHPARSLSNSSRARRSSSATTRRNRCSSAPANTSSSTTPSSPQQATRSSSSTPRGAPSA